MFENHQLACYLEFYKQLSQFFYHIQPLNGIIIRWSRNDDGIPSSR